MNENEILEFIKDCNHRNKRIIDKSIKKYPDLLYPIKASREFKVYLDSLINEMYEGTMDAELKLIILGKSLSSLISGIFFDFVRLPGEMIPLIGYYKGTAVLKNNRLYETDVLGNLVFKDREEIIYITIINDI